MCSFSDSPTLPGGGREVGGSAADETGGTMAPELEVDAAAMRLRMNRSWLGENSGGPGLTRSGGGSASDMGSG